MSVRYSRPPYPRFPSFRTLISARTPARMSQKHKNGENSPNFGFSLKSRQSVNRRISSTRARERDHEHLHAPTWIAQIVKIAHFSQKHQNLSIFPYFHQFSKSALNRPVRSSRALNTPKPLDQPENPKNTQISGFTPNSHQKHGNLRYFQRILPESTVCRAVLENFSPILNTGNLPL